MAERALYTREELKEQIKQCGQSIIDNADSILGDERYFLDLLVSFRISRSRDEIPLINVSRKFTPEQQIENQETYQELKLKKEGK